MERKFSRIKSTDSHELATSKKARNSEIFHEIVQDAASIEAFLREYNFEPRTALHSAKSEMFTQGYLYQSLVETVRDEMYAPPELQDDSVPLTESETTVQNEVDAEFQSASQKSDFVGSVNQEIQGDFTVSYLFDHRRGSNDRTVVLTDMADNQYVYRGRSEITQLNVGDVIELNCKVKAHEVYHGRRNQGFPIKQTAISYPTLLGILEHAVWEDEPKDDYDPQDYVKSQPMPKLNLPTYQGRRDVKVTTGYQPKQFQKEEQRYTGSGKIWQSANQRTHRARGTRGRGRKVNNG